MAPSLRRAIVFACIALVFCAALVPGPAAVLPAPPAGLVVVLATVGDAVLPAPAPAPERDVAARLTPPRAPPSS